MERPLIAVRLAPALVLATLASSPALLAQPSPGAGPAVLSLDLGAAFQGHSDLLASPFRQHGSGLAAGIAYRRPGITVSLRGGVARTSSRLEPGQGGSGAGGEDVWSGSLLVRHLREVARSGRFVAAAGASLAAEASVRRHEYSGGVKEFFADLAVPLSAALAAAVDLDARTSLTERADVAVATLLFRSPFAGTKEFPDAALTGPWETNVLRHRLEMARVLSPRLHLVVSHGLLLLTSNRRRPLRLVRQELTVGLGYAIGGAR